MHDFDKVPISTRTATIFTISFLCIVAGSWWLNRSRNSEHNEVQPTVTNDSKEGGDISQYVPLALKEDLKGHVTIKQIFVHPLKSCKGIPVDESKYSPSGLEFDRQWIVLDVKKNRVITARDIAKMVLITVEILRDNSPHQGALRLTIPVGEGPNNLADGQVQYVEVPLRPTDSMLSEWKTVSDVSMLAWGGFDAYMVQALPSFPSPHELLSQYLGLSVLLCMKGPTPRACIPCANFPELGTEEMPAHVAFQDKYPIMLASVESLEETANRVRRAEAAGVKGVVVGWTKGERELKMERFRPNVVLQGAGVPFAEDAWEEIAFAQSGDSPDSPATPALKLVSKCTRCLLPNVDPQTGVRDAAVPFKVLAKFRKGLESTWASESCFGVMGVPNVGGVLRVGDRVDVRKWYGET